MNNRLHHTLLKPRSKGLRLELVAKSPVETSVAADQLSPRTQQRERINKRNSSIRIIVSIIALGLLCVGSIQNLDWYIDGINERDNISVSTTISSQTQQHQEEDERKEMAESKQHSTGHKGIAWLMTFPNSGTTFTSFLVSAVTGTHTATNYGAELHAQGMNAEKLILIRESASVFMDSPIPSWSEYNWDRGSMKKTFLPPNQGYILTKTHCGGYCLDCFVGTVLKDVKSFTRECGRGVYVSQNTTSGKYHEIKAYTPLEKVARAVHIIRDPFDNVVARFNFEIKRMKEEANVDFLSKYPKTRDGFRNYCHDLGKKYRSKEKKHEIYKHGMFDLIKDVPCYSEFIRYVKWHDLAFDTTAELGIPSMTIFYEDYANKFDKTKTDLLRFLEQDEVFDPPSFVAGKTYRHYYTEKEIDAVSVIFSKLSKKETKEKTKHYFKKHSDKE